MTVLTLKNISKAIQGVPILAGIDLTLRKGEKAGLVGRNGCGKTTLLRILAGSSEPDSGERTVAAARSIGFIAQDEDFRNCATVIDAAYQGQTRIREVERLLSEVARKIEAATAAGGDGSAAGAGSAAGVGELDRLVRRQADLQEEYALLGGYQGASRAEAVLAGVGFGRDQFAAQPGTLSGGELKRLQIARLLLGGHDVMLLDEPGNHLDIHGCEWLTRHLRECGGTLVIVSHDRFLLNAVSDRIVELEGGRLRSFPGNYDAYVQAREEGRETALKALEQRRRFVEKEKELIRRIHYGQKARQAKSRAKRLEKLEPLEAVAVTARPDFRFAESRASGESVLVLDSAGASAGGRSLFSRISLSVGRGAVLGVIGPNGSGKSTFLKMILGMCPAAESGGIRVEGEVRLSPTAEWVYFDQALDGLDGSGSVLDELRLVAPLAPDTELRSHVGRYLIRGDDVHKGIGDLSGGEKSRVLLAKIALKPTNVLVLDEPTNHLDIFAREALEEAIRAYTGTVIMVTHDRRLLDATADQVLLLDGDRSRLYHGNYSGLMAEVLATPAAPAGGGRSVRNQRTAVPSRPGDRAPGRVKRRYTFAELEDLIIAKETRIREIENDFYSADVYSTAERYRSLEKEAAELRAELDSLYREWDTWA